jgi:hypothetical protein
LHASAQVERGPHDDLRAGFHPEINISEFNE